ncbi:MAG TPA: hypothetical protein VLZ72_04830, partial [Flavobacterium sp.]|nr:hypothetical protein [Flavobacterium sp.]
MAQAPVTEYGFQESTEPAFPEITGGNEAFANGWVQNQTAKLAPLPFTFNFNGIDYNDIYIYSSGFAAFTTGATQPIPSGQYRPLTAVGNAVGLGVLGVFTRYTTSGLESGSPNSNIRYEILGTAPNREFVIQWKDAKRRGLLDEQSGLSDFQIRLKETTNIVEYWYNFHTPSTSELTAAAGYGIVIGIRGENRNDDYQNRVNGDATYTSPWHPTAAGTSYTGNYVILNTYTTSLD